MYEELVKRIRNRRICVQQSGGLEDFPLLCEAADAIEELSRKYIEERNAAVELTGELASKPRWIPVKERLPEKNQIVVVVQHGKTWDYWQFRGLAYLGGNIHKWNWKNNTTKTVDYWMPKKSALPQPPKGE